MIHVLYSFNQNLKLTNQLKNKTQRGIVVVL